MRRRRRSSFRKEKVIMLTSSALVLTALTATGFYVRNLGEVEEEQIIDFTELEKEKTEDQVAEAGQEPAEEEMPAEEIQTGGETPAGEEGTVGENQIAEEPVYDMYGQILEEDNLLADTGELDYDPNFTETDSASAEVPDVIVETPEDSVAVSAPAVSEAEDTDAMSSLPALNFTESDALVWPIVGNVLVNYSMDRTVYFSTLQQYKYSPAIVIEAIEGEGITAAADGKVIDIYEDPEIGTAVVMDLGDGYELTYGQLTDLTVSEGNYVTCGEIIGKVAKPTKYYSVEGTNVYFKLTKDGQPVNPLSRLG